MKKNAIVIAAIMFLAGCAHQGGYGQSEHGKGSYSSAPAPRTSQGDRNFASGPSYNASNTPMVFREKLPAPVFDETGTGTPASDTQIGSDTSADQLAQRVQRELATDSTGASVLTSKGIASNISVTSDKGTITLRGSVPSEQDKRNIGIRAAKIEGVSSVDNQLIVSSATLPQEK
jgi:osmotically-inducible protein OsmY